jgi:LPS-assembly protein
LNIVAQRTQDYIVATPVNSAQNQVVVQKLPSLEASGRDQKLLDGPLPVWFSFDAAAGLVSRDEPSSALNPDGSPAQVFKSGYVGRVDVDPHVYTAFQYKGFSLEPGITLGAADYSNSYSSNSTPVAFANSNLFRRDADFTVDLRLPALERIFTPRPSLHLGTKLKHVVEAEAQYEYVTGVNQYQRTIRFDQTDILSDTNQLTLSLTNRLYKKDEKGNVSQLLSWRVLQQRYFDPTFGGVAVAGQRTVVAATEELTPYAFLEGPRQNSPVVSTFAVYPYSFISLDWHSEYDTVQHKMVVNSYAATYRRAKFFGSVGETSVSTNPILFPQSNQISFGGGYGSYNRKGWNVAATELYDLLLHRGVFQFVQGSYNTDCCGFSVQYRRINFGIRNENQYLFSFSLANLGTFGSLQKQERIF